MVLIAEVVDKCLWTIERPRSVTANGELMLNSLVTPHIAVVSVIFTREF